VAEVLARGELDPRLVAHAIPLLARDELFDPLNASLRLAAPRSTGQLVDALLDPQLEPVVRRRVARVLKGVPTQRAADGLLLGLMESRFDLRYRCAQALLRIRAQNAAVTLPAPRVLEIAAREAAHAGESPRHLEHCFTLLGLVLERGPLDSAYRALQSADAGLRGTALEYLENVVPGPVREKLWAHLGATVRPAPSGRSPEQIRDELLRSSPGPRRPPSSRS
jgi:ATP:ADP antiporter, AAA family